MTWDMDSESTTAMMQDVGVSVLATDGEGTTKNENTDADTSSKPLNSFHGEVSVEVNDL